MKNYQPLPTNNEEWGFWGTSIHNGYDAAITWDTASRFFAKTFNLTPEETRTLLDARFGRHLADDLSFIKGAINARSIANHLAKRVADKGWRRDFEKSIHSVLGIRATAVNFTPAKNPIEEIAFKFLNFETLEERKSDSLDFHEVSVWSVKAALEAAFEAGKNAAKGA